MQRYTPPESNHKIDVGECLRFNRNLMVNMMAKKMEKNKTYLELRGPPKEGVKAEEVKLEVP